MPRVPAYQPQLSPQPMPAVRVDQGGSGLDPMAVAYGNTIDTALDLTGHALSVTAQRTRDAKDHADTTAAQMAVQGHNERAVRFIDDMRTNYAGVKAPAAVAYFDEWMKNEEESIGQDLTPRAKEKARMFVGQNRANLLESVLRHVSSEQEKASRETGAALHPSAVAGAAQAVSPEGQQRAAAGFLSWLNDQASRQGWSPETKDAAVKGFWGEVAQSKTQTLMAAMGTANSKAEVDDLERRAAEPLADERAGLSKQAKAVWSDKIADVARLKRGQLDARRGQYERTHLVALADRAVDVQTRISRAQDGMEPQANVYQEYANLSGRIAQLKADPEWTPDGHKELTDLEAALNQMAEQAVSRTSRENAFMEKARAETEQQYNELFLLNLREAALTGAATNQQLRYVLQKARVKDKSFEDNPELKRQVLGVMDLLEKGDPRAEEIQKRLGNLAGAGGFKAMADAEVKDLLAADNPKKQAKALRALSAESWAWYKAQQLSKQWLDDEANAKKSGQDFEDWFMPKYTTILQPLLMKKAAGK